MKSLLFCWVILTASISFSQSIQDLADEILVDKSGNLGLKTNVDLEYNLDYLYSSTADSLFIPTIESDNVFNWLNNSRTSRYYEKMVYQLPSGNQLRIDVILDTLILLEERVGDETIRMGEVRIDTTKMLTYEFPDMANSYGEDTVVVDTFYRVIPVDNWYSDVDGVRVEAGKFKNGQKDGVWKISLWSGRTECVETVLEEQLFEKGQLISVKNTGHFEPTDKELISGLLTKEWFGTRCYYSENDGRYFYSFKSTNEKHGSRPSHLDYLKLNNDGTYTEKSYHWCGTCSRKPIESKWYLGDNNELILDGYQYFIEYVSETELLLEVCLDFE